MVVFAQRWSRETHMPDKQRWDDLQAFLAIARSGRLTEAARLLGVEHTTLSRRLTRLEASLGIRLFDRRPVGYLLTPEGELVLPRAEAAERAALLVWSGGIGDGSEVSGTVRMGTPEAFGTFCLAGRLGQLAVRHPGLTIELVAMPRSFSLSKREADVAIGLSRPPAGRLRAGRPSRHFAPATRTSPPSSPQCAASGRMRCSWRPRPGTG